MKAKETWTYIHAERAAMADTWAGLSAEQWGAPSWCEGWTVQRTAGHVLAAAEQTPLNFYKELLAAGFKFDVFTARGSERLAAVGPEELVRRLRARTSTTNHPPAPVVAMLGEIVVHGEDIRRPLGLHHEVPEEALVAVADSWKRSNLLIGAKRRIAGLSPAGHRHRLVRRRRPRGHAARWSRCSWPWGGAKAPTPTSPVRAWPSSPPGPEAPPTAHPKAGSSPMTPRARSSSRRAASMPSSPRTSSLCWPRSGAGVRTQRVAASMRKGSPGTRWRAGDRVVLGLEEATVDDLGVASHLGRSR